MDIHSSNVLLESLDIFKQETEILYPFRITGLLASMTVTRVPTFNQSSISDGIALAY